MRRIIKKTIGIILVILGLVALLTPLTPGSWLIPIGLELLGLRILLADKLVAWGKAHPGGFRQWMGHRLLRRKRRTHIAPDDEQSGPEKE